MDSRLKQRLVGAAVLVALAVIFLPMLVKGPAPDSGVSDLPLRVPDTPTAGFKTVDLPLVTPQQAPEEGALGVPAAVDGDALTTVDTASARRDSEVAEPADDEPLPPTVAGGGYAVHYGAFASAADAQTVLRQLGSAQLTGYVEPYTLNGRDAQRVRLGPYATRAEAEIVRLRAASLREDVSPRVVTLDAERGSATTPAPSTTATTPSPAQRPAATPPAQSPAQPPAAAATPPTPPAAPPPAAAPDVGFVVQLGAFSNAADATALRDRLRGQGFTAFTDTVQTDKGRLTRVKAGPVADRAEAERLKSQVRSRAGIDGLVRQHP